MIFTKYNNNLPKLLNKCKIINDNMEMIMHKNFENMGIYDLRNYARIMGVNSPTTLKRAELIARINEIINGKQPEPKTNNKGRPPRHKKDDPFMLDLVLPDNLFKENNEDRYKSLPSEVVRFAYNGILSEGSHASATNILFKGFYKEYNKDFALVCFKGYFTNYSKENVVVLNELSQKYSLKDGDYIVGVANYIADKNVMLATDITYINDIDAKSVIDRIEFENILPCYATQILTLYSNVNYDLINKISPITKGSRTIFNIENDVRKNDLVVSLLDSLSIKNNLRTLLISIDDSPEDIGSIMMSCKDVEVCHLSTTQTREQYFEKVFTFISNCMRRLECKQEISIVFYDTKKFINAYAENLILTENLNESKANIVASNKLKDIFNLSRNTNNGNLTVIFVNAPDSFIENSNCYIKFMENPYQNTNVYLDLQNSFTKNIERIIDEKEYTSLQKFKQNFKKENVKELIENFLK